ncbi:MAG: hypothetical protein JST00_18560 [Deltaproteobacteria bacterium]|nr:hypothetical protein [Deltaproteobacteria bacterium]
MRHVPIAIRRAFSRIGARLTGTFADTPYVFFAVVIGVALVFRLGVDVLRSSTTPPPEVPVFASTEASATPPAPVKRDIAPADDAPASASTSANGGKAAAPLPGRAPARPRGHGRRSPHGG